MKLPAQILLPLLLGTLSLSAAERAAFGVVAIDVEPQIHSYLPLREGAVVDAVWPGSPADKAGVKPGQVITAMDGEPMRGRESLSAFLKSHKPGDRVQVSVFADGVPRSFAVTLIARPAKPKVADSPDKAVGGDRVKRPVVVSPEIREAMKARRATICRHLAAMPDGLDPDAVIDELQAIRNLARDANAADKAWMSGKAGEATLLLRDSEGTLRLSGASNSLTLEAYDDRGRCIYRGKLDTPDQRCAVPTEVMKRLKHL